MGNVFHGRLKPSFHPNVNSDHADLLLLVANDQQHAQPAGHHLWDNRIHPVSQVEQYDYDDWKQHNIRVMPYPLLSSSTSESPGRQKRDGSWIQSLRNIASSA